MGGTPTSVGGKFESITGRENKSTKKWSPVEIERFSDEWRGHGCFNRWLLLTAPIIIAVYLPAGRSL